MSRTGLRTQTRENACPALMLLRGRYAACRATLHGAFWNRVSVCGRELLFVVSDCTSKRDDNCFRSKRAPGTRDFLFMVGRVVSKRFSASDLA